MTEAIPLIPFAGLLLSIALIPLWKPHSWHRNSFKAGVSLLFSLPVLLYYFRQGEVTPLLHTAEEYLSFLSLLLSLFTISGGIHISGNLEARPRTNMLFLLVGAVLANLIGTTGASMLLIRPLLQTNRERRHVAHLPIFFIILVSNVGGLLTPLGDPPLFLGFLRGVPFFWTLQLGPIWAVTVGMILTVFYLWDRRSFARETIAARVEDAATRRPLWVRGRLNLIFLAGVLVMVFIPPPFREIGMVAMALLSWFSTPREIHEKNEFNFRPIVEVAILFAGIFITMVPALQFLHDHGASFPLHAPWQFFWLTGLLSSFLDNAPTYLTFFALGQGGHLIAAGMVAGVPAAILRAISCGAVMMGAMTYIGNGPNFMVKAICDQMGVKTPSFFGYIAWSGAILLPIFLVITFMFFV